MEKPDVDEISGDRAGGGRFGRKIRRGTRVRTWRRPRKFTIICGCFLRAAERHFASSVEHRFERIAPTKSLRGFCRLRRGGVLATSCTSSNPHAHGGGFETRRQENRQRSASGCPSSSPARSSEARFQPALPGGTIHEFSSPETLLDVDFSKPVYVLVDRLAVNPESRARLVDSIEICYREGQGEAVLEFVADGAGNPAERLTFNERFECKIDGNTLPGTRAPALLLQQSIRSVPALPGIRQHHRLRLESGRPRSEQVA